METRLNILAIGRNAEIMDVLNRLLNAKENWKGTTVTTDTEAETIFSKERFDLVMLCAGITEEEGVALQQKFRQINPASIIIRHYGGGSGLLENEILAALAQR